MDNHDVSTPIDADGAAGGAVVENAAVGTAVGITARANDADTTNNHVTYSLSSNPGGLFQIDARSGVVTTAAAIDYETLGATREIEVTATSADGSTSVQKFTIAIGDVGFDRVGGFPAGYDPLLPVSTAMVLDEMQAASLDLAVFGDTPHGDLHWTVEFSWVARPIDLSIDANGRLTLAPQDYELLVAQGIAAGIPFDGTVGGVLRAEDAAGQWQSTVVNFRLRDVDEADVSTPIDADGASGGAVAENVAVGTAVGITARANDADATTNGVTYSLTGNPNGLFQIDPTSGVVSTAADIDRETHGPTRTIEVTATSADRSTSRQTFTIAIGDLDEADVSAPVDADGASGGSVAENVAVGTAVGITARAGDADATTNGVTYSLSSNPDGLFQIDPTSGVVSTAADIDHETHGATRMIEVTATSADLSTSRQTFIIAIEDVDEAATASDSDASPNLVSENLAAGSAVGITLVAHDPDSAGSVDAGATFRVIGEDSDLFEVDDQGVVRTARMLDRESDGVSRNITIETTDSSGLVTLSQHTIAIGDVSIDPGFVLPPQVLEGEGYWVTPSIVGSNEAVTWSLEGSDVFTVVRDPSDADPGLTTGSVRLFYPFGPGGRPLVGILPQDFEAPADANGDNVYEVTLVATGASGWVERQTLQITVEDRNEPVSAVADADATANRVDEEVALNTYVGFTARAVDPDHTDNTVTYSLLNDAGGLLRIDDRTGEVFTNGRINFEAIPGGVLSGVVQASSSGGGASTTQAFQVTVGNINEPLSQATDVNNAVNYVFDSLTGGSEVPVGITVLAADPDTGDTVHYDFAENGNPDGLFKIDPGTGVVTTSGVDIDQDAHGATRTITVVATSSDGSSSTQAFTVDIVKNDHAVSQPQNIEADGTVVEQVQERVGAGTYVGIHVRASDADATFNDVMYSLTDDGDGLFTIDPVTGRVTTTGQAIDRETLGSAVDIEVQARSADGSWKTTSFDIGINDVPHIITGLEMVDIEVTPGSTPVRGFEVDEYIGEGTDTTGVILGTLALDEVLGDDAPAGGVFWQVIGDDFENGFAVDGDDNLRFYRGDFENPIDADRNNVFVATVMAVDIQGNVLAEQQVAVVQRNVDFRVVVEGQATPADPNAPISVDLDEMQTGQVQLQVIGDRPVGNLTWSFDFAAAQNVWDWDVSPNGLVGLVSGQDFETLRDSGAGFISYVDQGEFILPYDAADASDGVLTVFAGFAVHDQAGNTGSTIVEFNIHDVPEIAPLVGFTDPTENDASWSFDLNLLDTPPGVRWSIGTEATDGADGALFDIDEESGVLTLREPLDSEYDPDGGIAGMYLATVVATASNGSSARITVGVAPEDVPLLIDGADTDLFTVQPGAVGQVINDFDLSTSGDVPTGTTHWAIVRDNDDDNIRFNVDADGRVTFDPGTTAHDANDDRVGDGIYTATLRATDGAGQEATVQVQVDILGPPDLNIAIESDGGTTLIEVVENWPNAWVLTADLQSDQEDLTGETWSLTGPDWTKFDIDRNGRLTMPEELDYESGQKSFNFTLVGDDGRGHTKELPITVQVADAPLEIVTSEKVYHVNEQTALLVNVSIDASEDALDSAAGNGNWEALPESGLFEWVVDLANETRALKFNAPTNETANGQAYSITLGVRAGDTNLTAHRTLTFVVDNVDEAAAGAPASTAPAGLVLMAGAELPPDAGSAPPPGWDPSQPLPPLAFVPPSDLEFIHVAPPLMFG